MPEREWHQLYFDKWVEREGIDLIRGYKWTTSIPCL
jgi:hypothetical protein